jgi:hypothetical protein
MLSRQPSLGVLLGVREKNGQAAVLVDESLPCPLTIVNSILLEDELQTRDTVIDSASRAVGFEFGPSAAEIVKEMLDASLARKIQGEQLQMASTGMLVVSLNLRFSSEALLTNAHPETVKNLHRVRKISELPQRGFNEQVKMIEESLAAGNADLQREASNLKIAHIGMAGCGLTLLSTVALTALESFIPSTRKIIFHDSILALNLAGIACALSGAFATKEIRKSRISPTSHAELRYFPAESQTNHQ